MGRASRRRAALRAGEVPGDRFLVPPELTQPGDGMFVEANVGGHRWALISTYGLTDDDCLDIHRRNAKLVLGRSRLLGTAGPLCMICEQPWARAHGKPCTGDPSVAVAG